MPIVQRVFFSLFGLLVGCANFTAVNKPAIPVFQSTDTSPAARQAASDILNGDYDDANDLLNQALSNAPREPLLNLLNGMAYQARSAGEGTLWDLAKIGYQLAQKFDPYLWQAPYLLGLMQVKERDFESATASFSNAALANPRTSLPLYSLAAVGYARGDLDMAYRAVTQALRLDVRPPTLQHYRIAVLCLAAAGDIDSATAQVQSLKTAGNVSPEDLNWLDQKIAMWQELHAKPNNMPLLAASPAQNSSGGTGSATTATRMAMLDVIIIRLSNLDQQSRGVNLLDGLSAQFTGNIINSSQPINTTMSAQPTGLSTTFASNPSTASEQSTGSNAVSIAGAGINTHALMLTVPAVTYTLNIANSTHTTSRMVANPTILAFNGKMSKFFVGSEMSVFMGGNFASAAFGKEFGLSVQVTPTFLSNDTLELQVETGFSGLASGTPAGLIASSSAILLSKMTNTTSALMRIGQTVAISTGTIYQEDNNQSKVPFLGDIPAVDTLLSRTVNSTNAGSFLVLLTVRAYPEHQPSTTKISINSNIPALLAQRLTAAEPVVQQRLGLFTQRDVFTVIRPQDIVPVNPLQFSDKDTNTQNWQQQFMKDLLSGT